MNSFLTSTSPSFGCGTGTSVLNCNTSVPPVFSICTAFIVFGKDDILLIWTALVSNCEFSEASRVEALNELESKRVVRAACEARVISKQRLCIYRVDGIEELVLDPSIIAAGDGYKSRARNYSRKNYTYEGNAPPPRTSWRPAIARSSMSWTFHTNCKKRS